MSEEYLEERLESLPIEQWAKISHLYQNGFYCRALTKEEITKMALIIYD